MNPTCFIATIERPLGIEAYVNKIFSWLDTSQYVPLDIVHDRLQKNELICPLSARKYSVKENGNTAVLNNLITKLVNFR